MFALIALLAQLFAVLGNAVGSAVGSAVGAVFADGSQTLSTMLVAGLLSAAAVVVVVAIARLSAVLLGWNGAGGIAPPDEDADLPVLVTYTDPDADGHTRSRAPALAA